MVEREVAARLLDALLDNLADLERYRGRATADGLRADRDLQHMVLHALYVAVQAALDLALHVGADMGLPRATTYQEAFQRLGEAGTIDPALAARLAGWAGLRNVLAHLYATVDPARVHDALGQLQDLREFVAAVARRLGPPGPDA